APSRPTSTASSTCRARSCCRACWRAKPRPRRASGRAPAASRYRPPDEPWLAGSRRSCTPGVRPFRAGRRRTAPGLPAPGAYALLEQRYTRSPSDPAMQPDWHEVPKHHQDRTWAIYRKSVPQLFLERAAARPAAVALRYKDFGLYQEVTWSRYRDEVEACALGLIALGAEPGDRIAIM